MKGEATANRQMLQRQKEFRRATELVARAMAELPQVQKVVLIGSVAQPVPKGKIECLVPGCGQTPFLQQHQDFVLGPESWAPEKSVTLFTREP